MAMFAPIAAGGAGLFGGGLGTVFGLVKTAFSVFSAFNQPDAGAADQVAAENERKRARNEEARGDAEAAERGRERNRQMGDVMARFAASGARVTGQGLNKVASETELYGNQGVKAALADGQNRAAGHYAEANYLETSARDKRYAQSTNQAATAIGAVGGWFDKFGTGTGGAGGTQRIRLS